MHCANDNVLYGSFALASFPGPRPVSCRLQYSKALYCTVSDRKSWVRAWEQGYFCAAIYAHSFIDDIQRDNRQFWSLPLVG